MSLLSRSCYVVALVAAPIFSSVLLLAAQTPAKEKEDERTIVLTPFEVSTSGSLGATPGGAKDIRFFRMGADRGEIPLPGTFTPEGLFSEHDLPLELHEGGDGLFRVQTAVTTARFEVLPEVRYLAQLGLSSGLLADTWQPAPLNLIAVIDKSGSMSGEPLALVRASLKSAVGHMRNGDQLSIVLYGDRSHVHMSPTVVGRATRSWIIEQIDAIESAGSTNMEAGLTVGYGVARETRARFAGNTRVMLFTDERPNVGATEAGSFMAMAAAAAHEGIGLTTIGVGVQFGVDLATKISSVRGGNLFFFSGGEEMKKTFAQDWDTLVTELAHDFSVRIEPAPGFRLAGVFGVPANLLRWDERAVVMDVATIFLSKRKGAIYFALAPDQTNDDVSTATAHTGMALAEVKYSYRNATDNERVAGRTKSRFVAPNAAQAGLSRGIHLVDQYLTLKKAAQLHHLANDQEGAYRLVNGLLVRLNAVRDRDLSSERTLVRGLHKTLAQLSGHIGAGQPEPAHPAVRPVEIDELSGLPRQADLNLGGEPDRVRGG